MLIWRVVVACVLLCFWHSSVSSHTVGNGIPVDSNAQKAKAASTAGACELLLEQQCAAHLLAEKKVPYDENSRDMQRCRETKTRCIRWHREGYSLHVLQQTAYESASLGILHASSGRYGYALSYFFLATSLDGSQASYARLVAEALLDSRRPISSYRWLAYHCNQSWDSLPLTCDVAMLVLMGSSAESAGFAMHGAVMKSYHAAARECGVLEVRESYDDSYTCFEAAVGFMRTSLSTATFEHWQRVSAYVVARAAWLADAILKGTNGQPLPLHPLLLSFLECPPEVHSLVIRASAALSYVVDMPNHFEAGERDHAGIVYVSSDLSSFSPVCPVALAAVSAHTVFRRVHMVSLQRHSRTECGDAVQQAVHKYTDASAMSDVDAARLINVERPLVLVDLIGASIGARPSLLAHNPAPHTVVYAGHPATTGMALRGFIADTISVPPEFAGHFTEALLFLPLPALYSIPPKASAMESAGSNSGEFIGWCDTEFHKGGVCAFNSHTGTDSAIIDLHIREGQAEILRTFASHLTHLRVSPVRRLDSRADHIRRSACCCVSLDTFPYGGHTTVLDMMHSGVCSITHAGERMISRLAASFSISYGCTKMLGRTRKDAVEVGSLLIQNCIKRVPVTRSPGTNPGTAWNVAYERALRMYVDGSRARQNEQLAFIVATQTDLR